MMLYISGSTNCYYPFTYPILYQNSKPVVNSVNSILFYQTSFLCVYIIKIK